MEDFVNYKIPSMFIISAVCDWKCCEEAGLDICQNSSLAKQPTIEISNEKIYKYYTENKISKAIVIGGLEPFLQFNEIVDLISTFRDNNCHDPFIIYTGYYPHEIKEYIDYIVQIRKFDNLIIKFGRFVPNSPHKYDELLGVELSSDNQYAIKVS